MGLVWESVETVGTLVRLSWTFRNVNEEYMVRIYRVPIGLSDVSPDDEVASGRVAGPGRVFFEDRTVPAVGKREWVNYFVGMEGAAGALLFGPYPTLLPERPAYASLRPAGPNPTREGPRFSLSLPAEAMGEPVTLYIYDCGGRLVRRSTEGESRMGSRLLVWDRKNGAGMPVGPGVYFFQVRVGDRFAETRKVVLLSP